MENKLQELLNTKEYDFRFDLGIAQPTIHLGEVGHIISVIAKHYAVLNSKAELDQMLCGMSDTLHVLDMVREFPQMRSLFVFNERPPLTADKMYDLIPAVLSPVGNNQRDVEEEIMMQWIEILNIIEGITHIFGCIASEVPNSLPCKVARFNLALAQGSTVIPRSEAALFY